jgi:hypothetical protein
VVAVLVSYQYCGDGRWVDFQPGKPLFAFPDGKAEVDQYTAIAILDYRTIATATTSN